MDEVKQAQDDVSIISLADHPSDSGSRLSQFKLSRYGTIMGLFSFTTYVSLGTAGAVYGPIYQAHGFYAVSFASAATVAVAALIALRRSLAVSPGSPPLRR